MAVTPVICLYNAGDGRSKRIFIDNLPCALVSDVDTSIAPAADELGHTVRVQVEGFESRGGVLALYPPYSAAAIIDTYCAVCKGVAILLFLHRAQRDDLVRLGYFTDYFLLKKTIEKHGGVLRLEKKNTKFSPLVD